MAPQQLASAAAPTTSPYTDPPVRTMPEVIDRLERLQAYAEAHELRGQHDGVASFSALYHRTARRIWEGIGSGAFPSPGFIALLSVVLANRYFGAMRASFLSPADVPDAWAILFDRRSDPHVTQLQFAAAGVSAHLKLDLAVAAADTSARLRAAPGAGQDYASYQEVRRMVTDELEAFRQGFETTWRRLVDGAVLDRVTGRIDGWLGAATLDAGRGGAPDGGRDLAWEAAEHLWHLRRRGQDEGPFVAGLDDAAARAGRSILAPVL